jgi:galactose mutarotase-like enzyme
MTEIFHRQEEGFEVVGLRTEHLEVEIVPALGARILTLRNRRTGRNWLWRPESRGLFANQPGDDFSKSTLAGADECLPTLQACSWEGRDLPDHGEVWALPWKLDPSALKEGRVTTWVELPLSPFLFTRTISLIGNMIVLDYEIENCGTEAEKFLWCWHPLFRFEEGDRIELPDSSGPLQIEAAMNPDGTRGDLWPMRKLAETEASQGSFLKAFTSAGNGLARLIHAEEQLSLRWDPRQLPWFGLWLTRGGWESFHHVALEPTNAARDSLASAVREGIGPEFLDAGGKSRWQLNVSLSETATPK